MLCSGCKAAATKTELVARWEVRADQATSFDYRDATCTTTTNITLCSYSKKRLAEREMIKLLLDPPFGLTNIRVEKAWYRKTPKWLYEPF